MDMAENPQVEPFSLIPRSRFDGKLVDSIELDGLTKKAQKLEDKHVEVVGKLSHRHGVERGDWAVLEVVSIKQVKS
jgi:hypothetical protein